MTIGKKDKCPPWSIQASKMLHDSEKKTIYYDNAIIKVYDLPIFYLPKLSHPDPSVKEDPDFGTNFSRLKKFRIWNVYSILFCNK